jgi:nitrous oxide reductase accessory protein NosL
MRIRAATVVLTIASLSAIGCVTRARSPEPVPVDRVECARCRMLISSENGGGEILSAGEDTRFYDDIGCLAADWGAHRDGARAFVRLGSGAWADAQHASYAQPRSARTPMGSGLAALATAAEARAADRAGRALTWNDVMHLRGDDQ